MGYGSVQQSERRGVLRTTVVVLVALVGLGAAWADVETSARNLENELMSPCCMTNTVAEHYSGASSQMKTEIRQMLAEGKTEQEVLDFYVAQHGPQILSVPPAKGFNLTAYLVPMAMLVLGATVLVFVVRKWRDHGRAEPVTAPAKLDPDYVERVRKELADRD
jgi:cytochrome c-type biogenesis protein CcmH